MSKVRCPCGHIIVDQTDNLPYKGKYFADGDYAASFGRHITFCAEYVQAREEGRQAEFLTHTLGETYPTALNGARVIGDDVAGLWAVFGHRMYECEQCGRLLIQPILGRNQLISYLPETETRGFSSHGRRRTA